jgi:predicted alpha-1,2-mannosidase
MASPKIEVEKDAFFTANFPSMKFARLAVILCGTVLVVTSCSTSKKPEAARPAETGRTMQNLVQYVNPLCGTGNYPAMWGDNNLFPGAVMPFGMIQWSPDSGAGTKPGGYAVYDTQISGFSMDHLSGAGCPDGGNFSFMPILGEGQPPNGNRMAFAAGFSHDNEIAKAGYYAVTLDDGIKVELTTTARTGFGRFTYPTGKAATMAINAASDVNGSDDAYISISPDAREVSGWSTGGYFCQDKRHSVRDKRTIYFCAVFNRPFSGYATWSGGVNTANSKSANNSASGAFLTFDTSKDNVVLAKVGISYVSIANARANIGAENSLSHFLSKDFDAAVKGASDVWNAWLNKVQVSGGTTNQDNVFYTMVYHSLIGPTTCSDVNGDYMGYDGEVHRTQGVQYANFSGWDIYRSEAQWLAMIAPQEAADMAQSLLADYQQGGAFPRWGVTTMDSGVMMGDPAAPIIADYYAFGATNFDTKDALAGLVRAATDPSVYAPRSKTHERDGLKDYLKLGYIPEHGQEGGYGCVAMVLEYDSADFGLSQLAAALGDQPDSDTLLKNAQNWRNLYNPDSGYIQMKRRDSSWAPGFTNNAGDYDGDNVYVEGNAAQYLWMVPFNYKGLADTMGGQDAAVKRLDEFFAQLDAGMNAPNAWLGNEPCLETPWIYDFWGQPYKTQGIVRRAMTELYTNAPAGYPGNDDLGEMSSWYIFGALGMYPELPGSDILVIGSPLFPKAILHLKTGDVTITANGAAQNAPYVHSLMVNGKTWNQPWLRFSDISRGATLAYDLSDTPDMDWGSDPANAPPSFDGGVK